jgi:GNAT superfamily N-acetyltransferase
MNSAIEYRIGGQLNVDEVIELYRASTLGERRPIDDRPRIEAMLRGANLTITAWDSDLLVGIARSLSDFSYATYLSCLAVRASYQKQGVGRELVRRTKEAAPQTRVILLAAPAARFYYPKIGFTEHESCWTLGPDEELR